jgi:DNA-directed RNA polymerase subunit M/transcription elongation factor TFIIS
MSSLQFWKNVPERYLYDSNILTYYIETYLYACLIFLDSAAKIKNIPEGETPSAQIRYFIFKSQGTLYDAFEVELLDDFLYFAAVKIMQSKTIVIKWCPNCNKPFIPSTRSDEIYCSRIFRGNRTCKQVGYENKSGPIKAYRSAYKTKNAIKNRNIKNNPHAETDFRKWVYDAKLKLEEAQSGRISLREFKEWLKK